MCQSATALISAHNLEIIHERTSTSGKQQSVDKNEKQAIKQMKLSVYNHDSFTMLYVTAFTHEVTPLLNKILWLCDTEQETFVSQFWQADLFFGTNKDLTVLKMDWKNSWSHVSSWAVKRTVWLKTASAAGGHKKMSSTAQVGSLMQVHIGLSDARRTLAALCQCSKRLLHPEL